MIQWLLVGLSEDSMRFWPLGQACCEGSVNKSCSCHFMFVYFCV